LAKELEQKAKLEEEKKAKAQAEGAEKVARLPIEVEAGVFEDPDTKMYTINITKKNKTGMKARKGQVFRPSDADLFCICVLARGGSEGLR
jgi:hypothetical protein